MEIRFKTPEVQTPFGPTQAYSWGRNGGVATHGVSVEPWSGQDIVCLRPITSKGKVARNNSLSLPRQELPQIIEALTLVMKGRAT